MIPMHPLKGRKQSPEHVRKRSLAMRGKNTARIGVMLRLWAKTLFTPDCWIWQGSTNNKGYGTIGIGGRHGGSVTTHRLTYIALKGDPGDLLVRHACDNRRCVRPSHLTIGTAKDNSQDMVTRNRPRGCRRTTK